MQRMHEPVYAECRSVLPLSHMGIPACFTCVWASVLGSSLCWRARRVHPHFARPAGRQPHVAVVHCYMTMCLRPMHAVELAQQRHDPTSPVRNAGITHCQAQASCPGIICAIAWVQLGPHGAAAQRNSASHAHYGPRRQETTYHVGAACV